MTIQEAVIVEGVRTPIGRRNGQLAGWHPTDLLAHTLKYLVDKTGIDAGQLDDVIIGCGRPIGMQSSNIARWALLGAGFPDFIPGITVERACGSGQSAVNLVSHSIVAGEFKLAIGGGVESMTHADLGPMFNPSYGAPDWYGDWFEERYEGRMIGQGLAAELLAEKYDISRQEMDEFSVRSHQLAKKGWDEGVFQRHMAPIQYKTADGETGEMTRDEGIRESLRLEKMASLKTPFKEGGQITGGNASQMSDGASALLLAEKGTAEKLGLKPIARLVGAGVAGADPVMTFEGVIPATHKALAMAGMTLDQIDRVEVNEAFAPVSLMWIKEFGYPMDKFNVNGGAIAIGHPLGASGPRLLCDVISELEHSGGQYGMVVICTSGGMATASIIERL
ncbi:MAG TPA: thiolase family protein [Dermatophilaceae bacterium]|nr:thiolase family protein [Dermatophilaceae bacterium]